MSYLRETATELQTFFKNPKVKSESNGNSTVLEICKYATIAIFKNPPAKTKENNFK